MNDLQKLIKLRGSTIREVAEQIGHGYHMTQKVIKRRELHRKDGSIYIYNSDAIETAVANLLGIPHHVAWGPDGSAAMQKLIREEIKKQAKLKEQELQQQWLNANNVAEKLTNGNV